MESYQELWHWDVICQDAFIENTNESRIQNTAKKQCNFSMAKFNPKLCLFASSGDKGLHLWLPSIK